MSDDGVRIILRAEVDAEAERLRAFRAKVLEAFRRYKIVCNCIGVTHDTDCPLGELEAEAHAS